MIRNLIIIWCIAMALPAFAVHRWAVSTAVYRQTYYAVGLRDDGGVYLTYWQPVPRCWRAPVRMATGVAHRTNRGLVTPVPRLWFAQGVGYVAIPRQLTVGFAPDLPEVHWPVR